MKIKLFTLGLVTISIATISVSKPAQAVSLTTIATDLNNARGITFSPDGTIYVAETGTGGNGRCQSSPSAGGQPICEGKTGSVTKISPVGKQERIFLGFESLALQPSKQQGSGPQLLQFDSQGNAYLLTGFAGNPGNRDLELNTLAATVEFSSPFQAPLLPADQILNTPTLAKLYKADLNTEQLTEIFDFGKYELLNNPDRGDIITNPYSFAIKGDYAYVTDGGGNSVYKVKLDASEVKAIPVPTQLINNPEYPPFLPGLPPGTVPGGGVPTQINLQSVPTGITVGPDGAVYFTEYNGFPYPDNVARIFRLGDDDVPQVYATGFSHATDLAFDKDGNLLLLQFSDEAEWKGKDLSQLPGSLVQLSPDGTRTTLVSASEGLLSSTGITVSPDNQIYIVKRGVGTNGEVVKVDRTEKVPEPASAMGLVAIGALCVNPLRKRKR